MSYLDRKNILDEGFFGLLKKLKAYRKLSPAEKRAMRNPKVRKAKQDFDKAIDTLEKAMLDLKIEK